MIVRISLKPLAFTSPKNAKAVQLHLASECLSPCNAHYRMSRCHSMLHVCLTYQTQFLINYFISTSTNQTNQKKQPKIKLHQNNQISTKYQQIKQTTKITKCKQKLSLFLLQKFEFKNINRNLFFEFINCCCANNTFSSKNCNKQKKVQRVSMKT